MGITLRPETEAQIEARLQGRLYSSADDVVRAGLRLLKEREQDRRAALGDVRRKVAVALAELDRGDNTDGEAEFERLLNGLDTGDDAR